MFVHVKTPTDPVPLKFGPHRFALKHPERLLVFSYEHQIVAQFSEYEDFWEEADGDDVPRHVLLRRPLGPHWISM
jgi:hypothetical protein